ncbi:MAG: hypothetical protein IJY79_04915 [Clostridia bacterium]|nr:hypothetical protein [Clostridia bacterium]
MKKSLLFWQFAGFVFTGVVGTLLHFLYDWTDSAFVALFSAVNESTWEHMKILFFPLVIFALLESRYFAKDYKNFWCAKLVGIMTGLTVIPLMYYTYTGVLGVSADWFNIAIFFIAAAVAFIIETRLMKSEKNFCLSSTVAIVLLCIITVLFMIFTFATPNIPLFEDPITKTYGLV